MKILFEQGTPAPLRKALLPHTVATAYEMRWNRPENGALIAEAEKQFDAFITTDKNLRYQQNLTNRRLAILILPTRSWIVVERHVAIVSDAVGKLKPGDFVELDFQIT